MEVFWQMDSFFMSTALALALVEDERETVCALFGGVSSFFPFPFFLSLSFSEGGERKVGKNRRGLTVFVSVARDTGHIDGEFWSVNLHEQKRMEFVFSIRKRPQRLPASVLDQTHTTPLCVCVCVWLWGQTWSIPLLVRPFFVSLSRGNLMREREREMDHEG